MSAPALLSRSERRLLGVQLTLAMLAGGLLLLAIALRLLAPDQADVAELVAGAAAALVAIPALAAAWHSLRHPDLHGITDQLIALALVAAWAAGDLITAALLPLVMTVGHVLEERSLLGSREAIAALGRLTQGRTRRVLASGAEEDVPTSALRVGERVRLRAGDLVPADGVVESGDASLDTASLTGESVPEDVGPGAAVFAGAVNLDGVLTVRIDRTGTATTLGRVIALMRAAERAKPPVSRLLERYAGRYLVLSPARCRGAMAGDRQHTGDACGAGRLLPLRPGPGRPCHLRRRHRGGGTTRHPGKGLGLPRAPRAG